MALTTAGLTTPTLAEIKDTIDAQLRGEISPTLDLSASSPEGQLVMIFARQTRRVWETVEAIYAGMGGSASGAALRQIAALTGTYARGATRSRVTATVVLDAGTYPAGSLIAHVDGRPQDRFENADEIVQAAPGGASAVFVAQETGPIQAPANTLQTIAGPVAGWSSVDNPSDATVGLPADTDAQLRIRRVEEIEALGSARADAIRADILRLPGVVSALVLENDTDTTDADGLPPWSVEAIVFGPASPATADNEAVAQAIYESKAAGVRTTGTTTVEVTGDQGIPRDIHFTRPAAQAAEVEIELEYDAPEYPGDAAVQQLIADRAAAYYRPGRDLAPSRISAWAHEIPGVLRVTLSRVRVPPGAFQTTPLSVDVREYITLGLADILITGTAATP